MSRTMLIDASHPEETRVAVVDGTRLEELDFESAAKRQIRGNVYLARVTRVEPSLQAAFVEYGGNRHGFLAFSEIHPDYYQIPVEDRQAIIEAEHAESLQDVADEDKAEEAEEKAEVEKKPIAKKRRRGKSVTKKDDADAVSDAETEDTDDSEEDASNKKSSKSTKSKDDDVTDSAEEEVEQEQAEQLNKRRKRMSKRRYKIQEVIKRGQILLIQAVKEERGNKGAAVTTYMSLAGRYCVLMPNTPRGGGISRKIANGSDRKRLKAIMSELSVPKGMGLIVRTAGAKRTKAEIKRDFTYLSKLWDTIRDTTLKSVAPCLIHEEANLVKRSIRDLYGKDIDKVYVQGDEGYRLAKDFIKLLMPSHAKNVQPYTDDIPLFLRYQVESQIEGCLEPIAQLKSGGYLVIHPTEALVSVDVNSGRSTKERNVERTALKTNLEAAEEVARQMRLRDLAGLVVIDFIDMDQNRNNRAVEKKMRDALAQDRARVQMGRISQFGLMELSRQRRRRSLLEGSSASCEHCHGVGRKRSIESSALKALRAVEEESVRGRAARICLKVTPDVAAYLLNEKRELVNAIESDNGMFTKIVADDSLIRPAFSINVTATKSGTEVDPLEEIAKEHRKAANSRRAKPKRNKGKQQTKAEDNNTGGTSDKPETDETAKPSRNRRRRGRRGGKNRRPNSDINKENTATDNNAEAKDAAQTKAPSQGQAKDVDKDSKTKKPVRKSRRSPKKQVEETTVDKVETEKPRRRRKPVAKNTDQKTVKTDKLAEEKPASKGKAKKSVVKKKTPKTKSESTSKAKPKKAAVRKDEKTGREKTPAKAKKAEESKASDTEKKAAPKKAGWWQKRKPFG
jgi:ribonuclease E